MSRLPSHKTRIICTIGPASQAASTLDRLVRAGMDVARLNLAHGDFDSHRSTLATLRAVAARLGRRVAIMADLPGPKLRVGPLSQEVLDLKRGQLVRLVVPDGFSDAAEVADRELAEAPVIPFTLGALPETLVGGEEIFLNDGLIQLRVQGRVAGREGVARVLVGGELRSRDGISLPGIDLGIPAFTQRDRELLTFALEAEVDAIAVSFVEGPEDIEAVREAALAQGHDPFIIAKIERARAVERIEAILEVTDGLMVARGDLGVETPIESVAVVQKLLIGRANDAGRPVITATQMLESMTENRRPTRAEVTDVANAVLDGTDCVMLSEETAMGQFPVEAVAMMSAVAATTERRLPGTRHPAPDASTVRGVLAEEAADTAARLKTRYILVPTETGTTARSIARLRPEAWILAFSPFEETCQRLQFSRGVLPVFVPEAAHEPVAPLRIPRRPIPVSPQVGSGPPPASPLLTCQEIDWHGIARRWVKAQGLRPGLAVMIQGNHRLEVLDLTAEDRRSQPS